MHVDALKLQPADALKLLLHYSPSCSVLTVHVVALGTDICGWCYVPSYGVSSWKLSPKTGPDRCGKMSPSPGLDPWTVQPVPSEPSRPSFPCVTTVNICTHLATRAEPQ